MPHRRRLAKHRKITSRPANRIVIALQRTGHDMRARYVVAARTLPTISGNVTLQVRTPSLAAVSFDKEFQQFDLLTPRRIGQPPASLANLHPPLVPQCHGNRRPQETTSAGGSRCKPPGGMYRPLRAGPLPQIRKSPRAAPRRNAAQVPYRPQPGKCGGVAAEVHQKAGTRRIGFRPKCFGRGVPTRASAPA